MMKEYLAAYLNVYDYIPFSSETLIPWLIRMGAAISLFIIFFLSRKYFTTKILDLFSKITRQKTVEFNNYLMIAFERPLRLFFISAGIYLAFIYLPFSNEINILISKIFRSTLIIIISLDFYSLAGNYGVFAEEVTNLAGIKIDKILIPFLTKILKFIIIVLTLSIILQEWEYDINGFIAGLGLGGLAFALAAQQTLSNLFAGVVIITDKPFTIGDLISAPSVEGTVEDINFRSTRIRTLNQALITVPNATLANEPITNLSRMGKRRITFNLPFTYNTPKDKMEECILKIKDMLHHHDAVYPEKIFVNFDSFKESSFNIFVDFFTYTTNWGEFLQIKEDVNLKIITILENEAVSLAFPCASIFLDNNLKQV
jgi:MscS family membrane protein